MYKRQLDFSEKEQFWSGSSAIVAEDVYGGLWFKSDTGSFGYINPLATPHYSNQSGFECFDQIYIIKAGNNEIVVENLDGHVYRLRDDSLIKVNFPTINHIEGTQNYHDSPNDFCYNSDDSKYWFAFHGFVMSWDGKIWNRIDLDTALFDNLTITNISVLPNGKIGGSTLSKIFVIADNEIIPISESLPKFQHFVTDAEGRIWVGNYDGLWICLLYTSDAADD